MKEVDVDISKTQNLRQKLFISLPMRGKTEDEIFARMGKLYEPFFKDYELIRQYLTEPPQNPSNNLYFLAHSIELMGEADLVLFAKDWSTAVGCRIERMICALYNIPYIEEENIPKFKFSTLV